MRFVIYGAYQGSVEEIDTADTKDMALYLVQEYQMAYGSTWRVYWRKVKA